MNVFLDTHTLLWVLDDDKRLPEANKRLLSQASAAKYVSVISFWEIAIKQSLGKLRINHPLDDVPRIVQKTGYQILPVLTPHVIAVANLPFHHKDPFDRLLVAQAQVENLALMTKDPNMEKYGVNVVWKTDSF